MPNILISPTRYLLPTLLRPKVVSGYHRLRQTLSSRTTLVRSLIALALGVGLFVGTYSATKEGLEALLAHDHLISIEPRLLFNLLLTGILAMLCITTIVTSLSTLYLAKDLDLLRASPLKGPAFLWGKLCECFFSASWITILFCIPTFMAFGTVYGAPWSFYPIAIGVFAFLLLLPTTLSLIVTTLFTSCIPAHRSREVLLLTVLLAALSFISYCSSLLPDNGDSQFAYERVSALIRVLSMPKLQLLPSAWAAAVLGHALGSEIGTNSLPYLTLLIATNIAALSFCYITLTLLYEYALSKARDNRGKIHLPSRYAQMVLRRVLPFAKSTTRALVGKEIKRFTRDMSQTVQLALLLSISFLYLSNLSSNPLIKSLVGQSQPWWEGLLIILNLALGAFVITAICTRFVYPCISLEGGSWWILQTAPIGTEQILRTKHRCWLVAVASISSVILATGAAAINASVPLIIFHAGLAWILCYGLVGLAIGFGAAFARFDWDHPNELAASFGSLVFILTAAGFICLNLIPVGFLLVLRCMKMSVTTFPANEWYLSIALCIFLLIIVNHAVARYAIKAGVRALEAQGR